ncbi:MAG: BadF/BadG/BcrA/BcrD ATPase family protein [Candidatus Tyrphobacter sp.]
MRYVAGIDGGQSGTQAAVADEEGRVVGRGEAGPADENWQGAQSTRMRDALAGALAEAVRDGGLDVRTRFEAIVAGVSGYEGRRYGVPPDLPTKRFVLVHDVAIAHAGALRGRSGVVVIAGTGSSAYVVDDDGQRGICGGFGYVFGDEGSAFWIVKTALSRAATHGDPALEAAAANYFGERSIREIFAAFYHGSLSLDRFASFARVVIDVSEARDDGFARETATVAQERLADLAKSALRGRWRWNEPARASFVGGLMSSDGFKRGVYRSLRERAKEMQIVEPANAPAIGAVILAMREARFSAPLSG